MSDVTTPGPEDKDQGPRPRKVDRPALVVALLAPLGAAAVTTAVALGMRDDLPDPVARHWSGSLPDGFSSLESITWVAALLIAGLGILLAAPAGSARIPLLMRRLLLGAGVGTGMFIGVSFVGSLVAQRGLEDAREATFSGSSLGLALLIGLGTGALAARVPRQQVPPTLATKPPKKNLPRVPAGGPTVLRQRIGFAAELRVDDTGLVVRWFGIRALTVPLAEIAGATVTSVTPWQFGGWGLRISVDGRLGFITRGGEAVDVVKADGQHVVVSTTEPLLAAGILNSAATEARRTGRRA